MERKTDISKWLTDGFLRWQLASGEKHTVTEYAAYLGVSRDTLNKWMNGTRTPTGLYVRQLAEKLGPEIYDVLKLARPEPPNHRAVELNKLFSELTDSEQEETLAALRLAAKKKQSAREKRANVEKTSPGHSGA